ncbi:MAG: RNA methyltransferase [Deltaproteobacteria bacterium]|nr:RNA methyltransferase [Deltaproteobacteria bacterium]
MVIVGLVHWPCLDKNGKEITTAITNMDLHDFARVCLTYGIEKLYIVHPYKDQLNLAGRIIGHWLKGFGSEYNPLRRKAFEVIRLAHSLDEVKKATGAFMIATSARYRNGALSWDDVRALSKDEDILLIFGTGWGLAPRVMDEADATLEPIKGIGPYNHLSVRAAMAISIDRILGR